MGDDGVCARCGQPDRHGVPYSAGFWGYTCDPDKGGRDVAAYRYRRVYDVADAPEVP